MSENIAESELFGHVKGSFTGANKDRMGKFELANHGTLFLDEIGELSLNIQAKLLRALQEVEIQRVGADKIFMLMYVLLQQLTVIYLWKWLKEDSEKIFITG